MVTSQFGRYLQIMNKRRNNPSVLLESFPQVLLVVKFKQAFVPGVERPGRNICFICVALCVGLEISWQSSRWIIGSDKLSLSPDAGLELQLLGSWSGDWTMALDSALLGPAPASLHQPKVTQIRNVYSVQRWGAQCVLVSVSLTMVTRTQGYPRHHHHHRVSSPYFI